MIPEAQRPSYFILHCILVVHYDPRGPEALLFHIALYISRTLWSQRPSYLILHCILVVHYYPRGPEALLSNIALYISRTLWSQRPRGPPIYYAMNKMAQHNAQSNDSLRVKGHVGKYWKSRLYNIIIQPAVLYDYTAGCIIWLYSRLYYMIIQPVVLYDCTAGCIIWLYSRLYYMIIQPVVL